MQKHKKNKKKCCLQSSNKIVTVFLAITVSVLMAGFIVQAQIASAYASYWYQAAAYYYNHNLDLQELVDKKQADDVVEGTEENNEELELEENITE